LPYEDYTIDLSNQKAFKGGVCGKTDRLAFRVQYGGNRDRNPSRVREGEIGIDKPIGIQTRVLEKQRRLLVIQAHAVGGDEIVSEIGLSGVSLAKKHAVQVNPYGLPRVLIMHGDRKIRPPGAGCYRATDGGGKNRKGDDC